MSMKPDEAAKVLRQFNDWRRDRTDDMPDPEEIGFAIDAAVAALEAVAQQSPPSTNSRQPAADSRHPRERVLAQDAARGNAFNTTNGDSP